MSFTDLLESCVAFNEAAKLALRIQATGRGATEEEMEKLKSLLGKCESEEVNKHLTEDEKNNIKLWKMMLQLKDENSSHNARGRFL